MMELSATIVLHLAIASTTNHVITQMVAVPVVYVRLVGRATIVALVWINIVSAYLFAFVRD